MGSLLQAIGKMRATFLCLFALQLAFAVMAMPRARAQDEGGEEGTPEPAAGGDEGGDEAPPADGEGSGDGGEGSGGEAGEGGEEAPAGEEGDPPAEAVRENPRGNDDAMRAVDEAARNMDRDRNVAKQKLEAFSTTDINIRPSWQGPIFLAKEDTQNFG